MGPEEALSILVRAAIPADTEILGKFGAHLMALHHQWDRERFLSTDDSTPASYAEHLRRELGKPDVVILIAHAQGSIVGYSYARMEGVNYMALRGPAGVIHDIFIDQIRRREGLGRMLLDATTATLAARGAKQIVLSTAFKNVAAQRLFASAGLRPTMIEMTLTIEERDSAQVPNQSGRDSST